MALWTAWTSQRWRPTLGRARDPPALNLAIVAVFLDGETLRFFRFPRRLTRSGAYIQVEDQSPMTLPFTLRERGGSAVSSSRHFLIVAGASRRTLYRHTKRMLVRLQGPRAASQVVVSEVPAR